MTLKKHMVRKDFEHNILLGMTKDDKGIVTRTLTAEHLPAVDKDRNSQAIDQVILTVCLSH